MARGRDGTGFLVSPGLIHWFPSLGEKEDDFKRWGSGRDSPPPGPCVEDDYSTALVVQSVVTNNPCYSQKHRWIKNVAGIIVTAK